MNFVRNHKIFSGIAGVVIVFIVVLIAVGAATAKPVTTNKVSAGSAQPAASQPAYTPSAAPTPPPTEVEFIITGHVPAQQYGNVDINYGSDSDSHEVQLNDLDGTLTYKVPFDSNAEYYSVDVDIDGGQAPAEIVVTGPGLQPLTVSHGSATGNNIASAQAAPENGGLSWDNEQ